MQLVQATKQLLLLGALVLLAVVSTNAATIYKGKVTAYSIGGTSNGNCNMMYANADAATNYVAINGPQWNNQANCGRCVKVTCTDKICKNNSTMTLQILDQCPGCASGDLDVSNAVYKTLTGTTPNTLNMQWQFVDCPITGKLQYCLKSGSNPYWIAIQPVNSFAAVKSVTINGVAATMLSGAYYYLVTNSSPANLKAVKVVLTSTTGEVITDTVSLAEGKCTAGKFQFTKSSAT